MSRTLPRDYRSNTSELHDHPTPAQDTFTNEKALKAFLSHFKRPIPRLPPISDSPNVTFDYTPQWPRTGKMQRAFGKLGQTKEDTTTCVRRGLPALSGIESERLNFEVCLYPDSGECQWVTMMEEAWQSLAQRDGLRVRVIVEDSPEERVMRAARDESRGKVLAGGVGVVVGIPLIYGLFTFAGNLTSTK